LAEKGQWDQVQTVLKKIPDYQWAANVSTETFLEYERLKSTAGTDVIDPGVWVELQKGKQNLDQLIIVLEKEIDRLDKKVSDNFFKLQKKVEEFQNI
jgi:hypothetical protein